MSTLAEARAELGNVRARQDIHKKECPCRNRMAAERRACPERAELEAESKRLREEIRTWFDMPADAEGLF